MKRLLITSLLALVLFVGVPAHVFAQELGPDGCPVGTTLDANGNCVGQGDPTPTDTTAADTTGATDQQKAQAAAEKIPTTPLGNIEAPKDFNGVIGYIFKIFAWLLGIAGLTLDNVVYYTVVKMGALLSPENGGLSAIGVAWRILRDMGNIILIFGFLAVGISTILGTESYGVRSRLPTLLIVAVFLNFSLFISEAVIDVGNLFATEFYTQINGGHAPQPVKILNATNINAEGISLKIMNQLGLQGLLNANKDPQFFEKEMIIGVMGILLFMVAAFVMFSLSLILIARFVVLVFLIIVAPVGFAGLAVPKLENMAREWWSQLFNQTITAPVLLLLLYVALAVITDSKFLTGFAGGNDLQWTCVTVGPNCQTGVAGLILSFLVAMGLLLTCTFMAKKLGAVGADWITNATSNALSYPFRAGAKYGVGYAGKLLAASNNRLRSTKTGRVVGGALAFASLGALSDYNVNKAAKSLKGAKFGTSASLADLSEFNKSRKTELDSIQRKRDAQSAITAAVQAAEDGTIQPDAADKIIAKNLALLSEKEIAELDGIKDGTEALVRNLSPEQFKKIMDNKDVPEAQKNAMRNGRYATVRGLVDKAKTSGSVADIEAAQKEVAKMSNKDLLFAGEEFLTSDLVATALTNDQYEYLTKEGALSATQKTAIDAKRKDRYDPAKSSPASIATLIKGMKGNRDLIKKVPATTLADKNVLNALGADALDVIDAARGAGLSTTDRQKIGTYLEDVATTPGDPRSAAFMTYINSDPRVKRDLLIP